MELTRRLGRCLDEMVRPATYPLAVKLLEDGELPQKAMFPVKNFGNRLALCQGLGIVRRFGMTVAFGPDDHQCPPALMAFGLKEDSKNWRKGLMAYPFYAETPEIGASLNESHLPRMNQSENRHILIAPLSRTEFIPDVVMVYGNSAQMHRLIMAAAYKTGKPITATLTERMGCLRAIIIGIQSGDYQVTIPGSGERALAFCGEDEMVFTIPRVRFEEICSGLEGTQKAGGMRYPTIYPALLKSPLFPPQFDAVMEDLGIKPDK